jgi:glucose/arabinose dehydrogenase
LYFFFQPNNNLKRFNVLKCTMLRKGIIVFLVFTSTFWSCRKQSHYEQQTPITKGVPNINIQTLATNRGIIWGFDSLPNGKILFTEKIGGIFIFDTSSLSITPITGLPSNISVGGQGGWLDICTSPQFSSNSLVYITYTITGNFLQLARFTLNGTTASNWQILQTTSTPSTWAGHYGSRICFAADGKLFWSVGEGGNGSLGGVSSPHQNAQLLNTLWGKIHRLNADGTVPNDNPIISGAPTPQSSIFSYGHRNPQGICIQPSTKKLYATEHGPSGGCELNLIEAGKNYGWPHFSNGINYNGTPISNGHNGLGITAPLQTFTPALAPGGLTFINHPSFKDWDGRLLSASLARQQLLMISLQNGLPVSDTVLFNNIGRVRNVKQLQNGKILFSVEDGRLIQITAR